MERRYWNKDATQHRFAVLRLPCRKCPRCLNKRAWHWSSKIAHEISHAPRTWFVTLTVAPARRAIYDMQAETRSTRRGVKWSDMTAAETFRSQHAVISAEITRYLKRVRERAGAPLRFALVCERHKDGYPHFHAVIHETVPGSVRYKDIIDPWLDGFAHAKLVQEDSVRKTASYVAKYLSKSSLGRVRASRGYGHIQNSSLMHRRPPKERREVVDQHRLRVDTIASRASEAGVTDHVIPRSTLSVGLSKAEPKQAPGACVSGTVEATTAETFCPVAVPPPSAGPHPPYDTPSTARVRYHRGVHSQPAERGNHQFPDWLEPD